MRVVVTGSGGMLGSGLVRRLRADGHQVHGVDMRPVDDPDHTVADIRDRAALKAALTGADAVVHTAAALPSYPEDEIRSVIVEGTRTVLTAARDSGVRRVVHISSTAVYGLPTVVPTTEEYPREPTDAYGRAKASAEEICESFRADGLCVPILRPKTFVGAGRMGLFAMLFEWAEEGRHFPVLGRGDVRIQMCAMEDLLDCVVVVLTTDAETANDTFNVAANRFGTLREDFQAVLDAAGHRRRVRSIPAQPALYTLELLRRARLSPVYGRLLHKLLGDSYVSTEKARQRLGFEPRLSNQEALLRAFDWWRQRPDDGDRQAGRTSREPWSQGVLRAAKVFF
ncbi:NAD-dependent epimerase/dehydratase family protein [Micromonospora sp. NPDC049171]|uniref:NAD-dependent epimerase/dehydratase family protein n=1 Tax=Micromonospora sp. NPDC049171 TaxID=3155770 RepID=UPI0033E8DC3A